VTAAWNFLKIGFAHQEIVMVRKKVIFDKNIFYLQNKKRVDPMVERHERLASVDWKKLTPRELEVAELIGAGLTKDEIGIRLGISVSTVWQYYYRINRKVGLRGIDELIIAAKGLHERG
jgi:DNA-binding CsgD family transcriptional regulator